MTKQGLPGHQILDRPIEFDTTSSRSNLAFINWVADYLEGFDIRSNRTFNDDKSKANLFASLGPDAGGGAILSGHTDVLPVDGQSWNSDPFTLTERSGSSMVAVRRI